MSLSDPLLALFGEKLPLLVLKIHRLYVLLKLSDVSLRLLLCYGQFFVEPGELLINGERLLVEDQIIVEEKIRGVALVLLCADQIKAQEALGGGLTHI